MNKLQVCRCGSTPRLLDIVQSNASPEVVIVPFFLMKKFHEHTWCKKKKKKGKIEIYL